MILQSEEVTYARLTLPRGKGYSPMVRSERGGQVYAKIDHSRSLFTGLLSPTSNTSNTRSSGCFSGPLEEEQVTCQTSLLVGSKSPAQYVIFSPEGQGDRVLLGTSSRESKV